MGAGGGCKGKRKSLDKQNEGKVLSRTAETTKTIMKATPLNLNPPPPPDLSFLAFLEFLAFFFCEEFLVFSSVFPLLSRDFRGSLGKKNPCLFGGFPCLFPKKQGKED